MYDSKHMFRHVLLNRFVLKISLLATSLATVIILSGCDGSSGKYEIVRAGNQTFILNNISGDARLIDGTSLVPVKAPDNAAGGDEAKRAKNWPQQTIPQLGDIKLTVKTKYRDGNMLYSVEAHPFQGRLEKEFTSIGSDYLRQPTLYVELSDADAFQIGDSLPLKIRSGVRIVNEKGEPYALSWVGSQPMSLETYRAASALSVRWAGFSKD